MRARTTSALLLLFAVIAGGYTAWWFYSADLVRSQIAAWIAQERARASFVEYKSLEVNGFPTTLRATATDFSIRRADGLEWRGPALTATAAPWNLFDIDVALPGRQQAALPGAGIRPPLSLLAAAGGTGRVKLKLGGTLDFATLTLSQVTAGLPNGEADAVALNQVDLRATIPEVPPADHTGTALTLEAKLTGLGLPPTAKTPLGRAIETAALTARIKGALPDRLTQPAVATWSRDGGTIDIDALNLIWGPLRVAGQGTLALDRTLQPIGAISTEVEGVNPTVDSLAAAGVVRPNDAAMAKVALGLLAKRRTPDNQPIVEASVTSQDGWLYLGPIRLLRMPRIVWE